MLVTISILFATFVTPFRTETVSLNRALELADQQHPLLKAGAAGIEGATAGILTARAYPNPEATVIAGKQTGQPPGAPTNVVPLYAVTQPLELGALRPTRVQLAQRGRESSEFYLSEVRRRRSEIAIATENVTLVEDLRNRIQVRVDVGEIGRLELVRAEAEVASARTFA